MEYIKKLYLSKEQAEEYRQLLTTEPANEDECMGEDVTLTNTVRFDNGAEMDIKLCGVQYDEDSESIIQGWDTSRIH